eukprot:416619_1
MNWFQEDSLESIDFGGLKSISLTGGIFLLINNAIGPGLPFLPLIYQQTGLLTCTIIILILTFISCIISMTIVESIQKIPDNEDFSLRIEYFDLIKYYCEPIVKRRSLSIDLNSSTHIPPNINSKKYTFFQSQLFSIISQIIFYLFMISLIITNLIQTCHIIDILLSHIFGTTFAIQFYPKFTGVHGTNNNNPFNPFNIDSFVLSLGTIICMLFIIPFCLKELYQIMWIQYLSIYILIIIILFIIIILICHIEFLFIFFLFILFFVNNKQIIFMKYLIFFQF